MYSVIKCSQCFRLLSRSTSYTCNTLSLWFLKLGLQTPHFLILHYRFGINTLTDGSYSLSLKVNPQGAGWVFFPFNCNTWYLICEMFRNLEVALEDAPGRGAPCSVLRTRHRAAAPRPCTRTTFSWHTGAKLFQQWLVLGTSSFKFPRFHQEALYPLLWRRETQSPLLGVLSVPPLPCGGLCHLPASPAQRTRLWCLPSLLLSFWTKISFNIGCF